LRAPPASSLFPYTTLFRSHVAAPRVERDGQPLLRIRQQRQRAQERRPLADVAAVTPTVDETVEGGGRALRERHQQRDANDVIDRSEEHTSELQSRGHLVCR